MPGASPLLSVVISTLNRPESLRRVLLALRYQRYPTFEVVVVEGPSHDDTTGRLIDEYGDSVRYVRCPHANLSRSRNLGIGAAGGEIVAFIDDDAVPGPRWLEQLVGAYDSPSVAGTGGIVYDYTGTRLQYVYSLSNRVGETYFDREGPFDCELRTGADPFVYLQGTNMSFRRDRLVEVGGFDEEIEYNFDEVELCLQMLDHGYELRPLPQAWVLHQYLSSHVRRADRAVVDPYVVIKNRVYFAVQHGRPGHSFEEILRNLHRYADEVREAGQIAQREGKFTTAECAFYLDQIDRGFEQGLTIGLTGRRQSATIAPPDLDAYRPFARLEPPGGRLNGCFLSHEYPPHDFGGVGRYSAELARGFAAEGHEIHVFTGAPTDTSTLDFEDGVWVHRVHARDRGLAELRDSPIAGNLYLLAANYHEVGRLHARSPVDFVSAPLWLCEGLFCSLDERFPVITTLVTSMKTIASLHPSWSDDPQPRAMVAMERESIARSVYVHAISQAILDQVRGDYAEFAATSSFVVPLGIEDRFYADAAAAEPEKKSEDVTVLFVGRLERRKGVDVLLDAAHRLLREMPNVSFVIAGKDTANTEQELSYRESFQRSVADEPELSQRVRFTGQVTEAELWRLYSECDVFCAPSRFESFGLVLIEAMMFAKPVIGCAAGGMSETIEHDVTGLLATPGDVESLTACLRRLVLEPELRRRLGAAARRRYLEDFELGVVTRRALEAYRDVADRRDRGAASPLDRISEAVAEVIASVSQLDQAAAHRVADRLLDPAAYPVDYRTEIENAWSLPPDEFVRAVYATVLLRAPLPLEAGQWADGSDRPEWRRRTVAEIARSQEARGRRVPTDWLDELERRNRAAGNATELATTLRTLEGPDSAFVDGVYGSLLARPAGPDERADWLKWLTAGAGRQEVIRGVAASDEARARGVDPRELSASLDEEDPGAGLRRAWRLPDAQFVRAVYHTVLGREPDGVGLPGHLQRLQQGGSRLEVVQAIARSDEARRTGDCEVWLRRLEASPPVVVPSGAGRLRTRLRSDPRLGPLARNVRRYVRRVRALPRLAEAQSLRLADIGRELAEVKNLLDREFARTAKDQKTVVRHMRETRSELRRLELEALARLGTELRTGIDGLAETVRILTIKQQAVSLDLRERFAAGAQETLDPRVVAPEELQSRIAQEGVRLNLGCGEKTLPGYINVDFRALPGVEIAADVRRLPFGPGEVDEIASWHLIEHFRQHELATVIVPYWRSLLVPGGILRIVCPNWEAMLHRIQAGDMTLEEFKVVTFGLQDYEGDDHFAMYSPDSLVALLRGAGFDRVDVIVSDRRNGLSTEMELVAIKPENIDAPAVDLTAARSSAGRDHDES